MKTTVTVKNSNVVKALPYVFAVLAALSICGCGTVSKEEQARRANQRQTDYVAEIDRRHTEAEQKEKDKTEPSFWNRWLAGDWSSSSEKEPPRELTEEELKPRR